MTCPRCSAEFKASADACPQCGVRLVRSVSGVMKTSAVMIDAGDEHGFYHSVQDVPEPLRTQLIEITNSSNAGTIVIADRAGKEQLTQVIARRESERDRVTPGGEMPDHSGSGPVAFSFVGVPVMVWAGVLLLFVACAVIAGVFASRW